jgi:hypothetical protein
LRAQIGLSFLATLSLVACQLQGSNLVHKPTKALESQAPTVAATSGTGGSGTAIAKGPVTVDVLLPPAGGSTPLAGTIHIDASYIVATGGGNIVAAGGGNIVAAGGGNIVAAGGGNIVAAGGGNIIGINGGNIIASGGGNIVAAGGGNLIPSGASGITATQGGSIVATGGGNIVAAGGGNIVAAGGGNIVAAGGGNIVAAGGGNFGLLAALPLDARVTSVAPPTVPLGTILPGVGLLVSAVSLKTHQYVPVGTNAKGQPVYVVYSNANGEYKLFLPKAEEGNVLVVATVPRSGDERLAYNTFTPLGNTATGVDVDEDTVVATRLVRFAFTERMIQILTATDLTQTISYISSQQNGLGSQTPGSPLTALLTIVVTKYSQAARAFGVPSGPEAAHNPAVRELAQLITDYGLGSLDYPSLQMTEAYAPDWAKAGGPPEQAYEALGKSLKALRLATLARQIALGGKDVHIPVSVVTTPDVDHSCTTLVRVPVSKATDFGDYLVKFFLATNKLDTISNTRRFYQALVPQPIYLKSGDRYLGEPGTLPNQIDEHFNTVLDSGRVPLAEAYDQDHHLLLDPSVYVESGKTYHHDMRIEAASYAILGAQLLHYQQDDLFERVKVRMKDYCDHHSFGQPVATPDPNAPADCVPTATPVPQPSVIPSPLRTAPPSALPSAPLGP